MLPLAALGALVLLGLIILGAITALKFLTKPTTQEKNPE